jgi:hypothetical protein
MRRAWIWLALAVFAAWAAYGFVHERLFDQYLWKPEGVVRLAAYTALFWVAAGLILWLRPAWLLPLAAGFVFVYSEWWCWRFFSPLAPVAVIYFLGSCFLLGRRVTRKADAWIAVLVGLAVWTFFISIAVHFPVNTRVLYATAFAIPYFIRRAWPTIRGPLPCGNPGMAVLLYVLLMHWLVALKPEVSADGLAMHLTIPAMIANEGRFWFDFQQYTWALMPMNGDLAFTATYLLGGEAGARLLNFALLGVIVAIVYRVSRRWLAPARAALVAALFASTPLVQLVTGSLFVENVWAALILGAAVALWSGEITAAGILLGAALATKVGTTAFLLPAVVLGAIALRKVDHRARAAAAACACLIVFAAPPFVYAYAKTGNPIFPFANTFFRSPYFDATVSLQDVRYRTPHDWNAFYNLGFRSGNYIEGQKGALGFQYFLLLPPLLLLLFRRDAPRAPVLFGLTGAAITFVSLPNLRYLYPAMPLISIGLAWLVSQAPLLTIAASAILALNVWFMPASGWYHGEFALFNRAQFDDYMTVSGAPRKLIEVANRTLPGEPVAFLHGDAIAGFQAKAYSDTWHNYKFWKRMITSTEPEQIAALFREAGIHYLITPMPPESDSLVVQHFVEEWTIPAGASRGTFELRALLTAPLVKPRDTAPAPPGSYDDLDQRIEYSHGWLHDRQFPAASGGTITYSDRAEDALRFLFIGTSIRYVYTTTFNRGIAEVSIDKKIRARLNLYSEETRWQQQRLFSGLDSGPHTIELRVTNRKDPKSSGYFVDLDRFEVNP